MRLRKLVALVAVGLAAWWLYRRYSAPAGAPVRGDVTEGDGFTVNGI